MKRTPVAHVIFPRPSATRPVSEFAWGAVEALTQTRDLDVSVFMPIPLGPLRAFSSMAREARGASPWPEGLEEVLAKLEPRPTLVPYLPIPRRSTESAAAALATALMARSRAGRPVLIQGSFLDEGGFAAMTMARVLGCRSIVVAHGTDVRAARGALPNARGRKRRALAALHSANKVIAVSNALAQDLSLLGARAEVIPFTSRAEQFPLAPVPKGAPQILFVGRMSRDKGLDLLLAALPLIPVKGVTLRLVGAASPDLDVERACEQLGIRDRVEIMGELPHEALPPLYAKASLLALPSRAEGLGNVLVESLLVGRPVVASDVGGIGDVVSDKVGCLVSDAGPGAFAQALATTLARVEHGELLPKNLRAAALPFAWESTGPILAELTRSMLH